MNRRKILIASGAAGALLLSGGAGMSLLGSRVEARPLSPDVLAREVRERAAARVRSVAVSDIGSDEHILGDPDAPITIIEYSSLTCPHCASFHVNTLPKLKQEWIDSGRARLVYRHYPLDQTALRAAMVTNCLEGRRFFGMIEMLFETQRSWARAEDPVRELARAASMAGMDRETFERCINDRSEAERIVEKQTEARDEIGVQSTPSFYIDGELVAGSQPFEEFDRILKSAES